MNEIELKFKATSSEFAYAKISLYSSLIMLHSEGISAQWPIDGVGISLTHVDADLMKLGFHSCNNASYQSFYFDSKDFKDLDNFFKALGFPMPKPIRRISPLIQIK